MSSRRITQNAAAEGKYLCLRSELSKPKQEAHSGAIGNLLAQGPREMICKRPGGFAREDATENIRLPLRGVKAPEPIVPTSSSKTRSGIYWGKQALAAP